MKKIIVFGAGNYGKKAYEKLSGQYEILAFADNNPDLWGTTLFSETIISIQEIKNYNYDLIIIATIHYAAIAEQMKTYGYDKVLVFEPKNIDASKQYTLFRYDVVDFDHFVFSPEPISASEKKSGTPEKHPKKALLIAYSFPPDGGAAVQRPLKFAKYLSDFGYEPIVLTSACENSINQIFDHTLQKDITKNVRVVRVNDPFAYERLHEKEWLQEIFDFIFQVTGDMKAARDIYENKKNNMRKLVPDTRIYWVIECVKQIESLIDLSDIDVIWSTVPSCSIHMLGLYLRKKYGIPWVADYRDLWTSEKRYTELYSWYTPEDIMLQRPLENEVVSTADRIVIVGESWKDNFVNIFHVPESRIVTITNGYDEADFSNVEKKPEKNDRFTLCYNGQMRDNCRNPIPLLKLINELIEAGAVEPDSIRWVINGLMWDKFIEEIHTVDVHGVMCLNGPIEHHESLVSAKNSDLMVFYGEAGEDGRLNYPGKFYEYLRIGNPILCLSGHNSFQEKVLSEIHLGRNFDFHENEKIKEYIVAEYELWKNNDISEAVDISGIERFNRKTLTGELIKVFDEIIAE